MTDQRLGTADVAFYRKHGYLMVDAGPRSRSDLRAKSRAHACRFRIRMICARCGSARPVASRSSQQSRVSPSFVIKLMQRFEATGDVAPTQFAGFKRSPLLQHEQTIRDWLEKTSDLTIAELCARLAERGTVALSPSKIG